MRILGIDPGLATVGIGVVEVSSPQDMTAVDWLTITTAAGEETPQRLHEIAHDLSELIKTTKPELAVVEQIFFSVNEKTAITVAQARGVILETLAAHALPILEPTPPELKSCITGDGNADKQQMQDMVMRMLHLEEIPQPDDAADALALAIFGSLQGSLGHSIV